MHAEHKMDFAGGGAVVLKPSEYRSFVKLIYDRSGINLGEHKQELLKTRLGKRLRALGLESYGEYLNYVSMPSNTDELTHLIDAISTNFTSFYREAKHFEILSNTLLEEIVRKKEASHSRKIRLWCAAASSGEEPYSLAITLLEYFKDPHLWDIKILATDISTKVLHTAAQGMYSQERVKTVPPLLLERYFDYFPSEKLPLYRVKNQVRQMVVFRYLNLINPVFLFKGPFDFIFCRNVLIYFDLPTQEKIVTKILKYIDVGGYLFTSHSENIPTAVRSQVEIAAPSVYRKVK